MNRQETIEWLTTVSNDDVSEYIIGMSFSEKRDSLADWRIWRDRFIRMGWTEVPSFRDWLISRVEQKILAERDASYYDAQEPI